MKSSLKIIIVVYIVVATIIAWILLTPCSEDFKKCICSEKQAGREDECQDTDVACNSYQQNLATEYSPLPPRTWTVVSPGDMKFPESNGCGWSNENPSAERKWVAWDYTDFGS